VGGQQTHETHRADKQGSGEIYTGENCGKAGFAGGARWGDVSFGGCLPADWLGEELRFWQAKLATKFLRAHGTAGSNQPLWGFWKQEPCKRQQEHNGGCANHEESAPANCIF